METKEKKVEVEINGKILRIPEHMLGDIMKFGATQTKRIVKNPPKELLVMPLPKKLVLPRAEIKREYAELPNEPTEVIEPIGPIEPPEPEKPEEEVKRTVKKLTRKRR